MNRLNSPLIGYDHFPMFIQLNGYFVDKTMFIRELFQKEALLHLEWVKN